MAYGYEYEIRRLPEASTDGSGMVKHEIHIKFIPDTTEPDEKLEYAHKTVCCPAQDVIDVAEGTGVVAAYKNMLRDNWDTLPEPITGPTNTEIAAWYEANQLCAVAVEAVDGLRDWSTPFFFPK